MLWAVLVTAAILLVVFVLAARGTAGLFGAFERSDPTGDQISATVTPMPASPLPPLSDVSGVWTGDELLVWSGLEAGGESNGGRFSSGGARFAPTTASWLEMAEAPIRGRKGHGAIWTGEHMMIWGGMSLLEFAKRDGAIYSPRDDSWRTIPDSPIGLAEPVVAATSEWAVFAGGHQTIHARSPSLLRYSIVDQSWQSVELTAPAIDIAVLGLDEVVVFQLDGSLVRVDSQMDVTQIATVTDWDEEAMELWGSAAVFVDDNQLVLLWKTDDKQLQVVDTDLESLHALEADLLAPSWRAAARSSDTIGRWFRGHGRREPGKLADNRVLIPVGNQVLKIDLEKESVTRTDSIAEIARNWDSARAWTGPLTLTTWGGSGAFDRGDIPTANGSQVELHIDDR